MTQYGVTALNKDQPLFADCVLSWIICLALNMAISPLRSTSYGYASAHDQPGCTREINRQFQQLMQYAG